jgi:hypothetical protein
MIGRRGLLAGVPAAGMAMMATPSAIAEPVTVKIDRLTQELSLALNDFPGFRAIVEPDNDSHCPVLLQNLRLAREAELLSRFLSSGDDREIADYHALQATKAMHRLHGGAWQLTVFHDEAIIVATSGWNYPDGVYQQFP